MDSSSLQFSAWYVINIPRYYSSRLYAPMEECLKHKLEMRFAIWKWYRYVRIFLPSYLTLNPGMSRTQYFLKGLPFGNLPYFFIYGSKKQDFQKAHLTGTNAMWQLMSHKHDEINQRWHWIVFVCYESFYLSDELLKEYRNISVWDSMIF